MQIEDSVKLLVSRRMAWVLGACVMILLGLAIGVVMKRGRRMALTEIEAMSGLARIHCREGNYDEAVRTYEELMSRTAGLPFVRLGLAAALFEKKDFREAEIHYRQLYETDRRSPVVLYNLGCTLYQQGKFDQARKYFDRFLALYGGTLPRLSAMARRMADKGR